MSHVLTLLQNYESLRKLFLDLAESSGNVWRGAYDWTGRVGVDVVRPERVLQFDSADASLATTTGGDLSLATRSLENSVGAEPSSLPVMPLQRLDPRITKPSTFKRATAPEMQPPSPGDFDN